MTKGQPGRPMKARPRILYAASELFLIHGLDVSLDTIAVEAGTTRQTLYNHFPNKDALVLETFHFLNDEMQPSVKAILSEGLDELPQMLMRCAKVVQRHFYLPRNIHFQRLLIQLLVQKPELYAALQQRPAQRVRKALADTLAQASEKGLLRIDDAWMQAAAFLGAAMGYLLPGALISEQPVSEDELERLAGEATASFLKAWGYSQ